MVPDQMTSTFTGGRANETFFYAYLIGWPEVSIHDVGWFEWSRPTSGDE